MYHLSQYEVQVLPLLVVVQGIQGLHVKNATGTATVVKYVYMLNNSLSSTDGLQTFLKLYICILGTRTNGLFLQTVYSSTNVEENCTYAYSVRGQTGSSHSIQ